MHKSAVSGTPKSVLPRSAPAQPAASVAPPLPLRLWRWRSGNRTGFVQAVDGATASKMVFDHVSSKVNLHPAFFLFQLPRDPDDKTLPSKPFCITVRPPRRHPWKGKK